MITTAPGSSPLARGLRDDQTMTCEIIGIIPARAGFTSSRVVSRSLRPDHPRSRGVYEKRMRESMVAPGSSPLARGLRAPRSLSWPSSGIIPARAGFTGLPVRRPRRPRRIIPARAGFTGGARTQKNYGADHPRSRGVYTPVTAVWPHRPWIIPARAGFTGPRHHRIRPRRDHPRSRGVYTGPRTERSGRRWIIPARAGFTTSTCATPATEADHPRSRGVYAHSLRHGCQPRGSSPLARGLREGRPCAVLGFRIIPARAGFTLKSRETPSWRPDHPRSRGVYFDTIRAKWTVCGSSPLARGLHDLLTQFGEPGGIIPARAGFTDRVCDRRVRSRDHPRSRGVYLPRSSAAMMYPGSSPLARGLQVGGGGEPVGERIIPARAGFTLRGAGGERDHQDHPRSRGVYHRASPPTASACGSSPLARGLPDRKPDVGHRRGIIPARAGFTLAAAWSHPRSGDHPRSRGVYSSA